MMNDYILWYPLCHQYDEFRKWQTRYAFGTMFCNSQYQIQVLENEIISLH